MKNLRISFKLLITFSIICLFNIVLGLASQVAFAQIQDSVDTFYSGPYQNKIICEEMKTEIEAISKYAGYAIVNNKKEASLDVYLEECYKQIDSLSSHIDYWMQRTQGQVPSITKMQTDIVEIREYMDTVKELLYEGEIDKAENLFFGTCYVTMMDMKTSITDFTTMIDANANNAYQTIFNTKRKAVWFITFVSVAALIIMIVSALYLSGALTLPIKELEADARRMEQGDFEGVIKYKSKDELGRLAASMMNLKATTKAVIEDTDRALSAVASGNFNVAPEVEYPGVYSGIESSIYTITHELSDVIKQIDTASIQVSNGSEQVSSAAQALSQGATEQAAAVEELSATIADISNQINDTAKNAREGMLMAQETGKHVDDCNVQMTELVLAMLDINEKSNQISKIIKTIEDIAFQTNILALNAAVEAARAGAAGKGFAVVADEVRNLAGKSANAAKDTTDLIEQTINAVRNGANLVDTTAVSLGDVVSQVSEVNNKIQLIADATERQATGINQVAIGMDQINSVVQTNSATSEESAAASEELNGQATFMKNLVEKFVLYGSQPKESSEE